MTFRTSTNYDYEMTVRFKWRVHYKQIVITQPHYFILKGKN
jgi:hypothetical protein